MIGQYTSQEVWSRLRRQAWTVWAMTFGVILIWVGLIVAAPVLQTGSTVHSGEIIHSFFGHICHQIRERSLHIFGHPLAVCSRCFGVYFGLLIGALLYPRVQKIEEVTPLPRFWLFLAMIPIGIDWSLGVFEIWENTHLSRFLTGTLLGAVCAWYIMPALIEIVRLISSRSKAKRLSSDSP